jgi:hypothetical protein
MGLKFSVRDQPRLAFGGMRQSPEPDRAMLIAGAHAYFPTFVWCIGVFRPCRFPFLRQVRESLPAGNPKKDSVIGLSKVMHHGEHPRFD